MALGVLSLIGTLGSAVVNGVSDHFEGKRKIKQAETEAKVARLQKIAAGEIEWDKSAVDQMQNSWKDEYLTIVLTIPAILVFIPGLSIYVMQGFEALAAAPDWYKAALGVVVAASFGYRKIVDIMARKK